MIERRYTVDEVEELRRAIRDDAPVLAVADFSPGRWWGFNGIQTLVLTADHLHVVQQGLAFTRGRLRRSVPTASIKAVSWRTKRFGQEVVRMTVRTDVRSRNYTSRYQDGLRLAAELPQQPPSG